MVKLHKETAREKFRNSVVIDNVQEFDNQDENYEYRHVCATFKEGLKRIDRFIDKNWEVVYSNEKLKDDRALAANQAGDTESIRQKPVTTTSRLTGNTYILMRCLKTQRKKNENEKYKVRETRFEAMQKLKPEKKGRFTKIKSDEIDFE